MNISLGPTHNRFLAEGYAAGVVGRSGEWLSVHSSRLSSRLVFPTPEAAEVRAAWLRERMPASEQITVRKVRRVQQTYFKILDNGDETAHDGQAVEAPR
ncbi:hypothetical protein [Nocardia abscessus]|uniref:hypothetical protein n=1 Tax=Nocardia abscessus TaxID=120957 RepID=UPI002458F0CC|nr:hypothetical protein [Nocardia abscessus]